MESSPNKKRKNRGKSSEDEGLFGSYKQQHKLKEAVVDMYYLLSREYPMKATAALVGNRYRLKTRQISALQGMSCGEHDLKLRQEKELGSDELSGKTLYLDGFNILILLETALSEGYIFKGVDGCYRDISSVHGTYRKVNQTEEVLKLVGEELKALGVAKVVWVFDTPVSNSGKLKVFCYELAEKYSFNWEVILDNAPDKFLVEEGGIIVSSDAWILNNCKAWFNLGKYIIERLYKNEKPPHVIIAEVS
ncbi:hypothetical protein GCM10007424_14370 [Flavobacterium suaedae]|uniref:DUF434 domain-containing protein n=1 Tax=Flavobacterium suaedae TaxID=1767027 RepID=A0ABQ1JSV1_9FLAO|nr:DUF434 domain-containing protein [Flavobacterium suaedae]GGB75557.1 hypothetical protein GCM10007424_14370 [Flavobacterium suaedae]